MTSRRAATCDHKGVLKLLGREPYINGDGEEIHQALVQCMSCGELLKQDFPASAPVIIDPREEDAGPS